MLPDSDNLQPDGSRQIGGLQMTTLTQIVCSRFQSTYARITRYGRLVADGTPVNAFVCVPCNIGSRW